MLNEDKRIMRKRQICSGFLNKNLSLNTPNENMRLRRTLPMKLSAFGEYGNVHKLEPISENFVNQNAKDFEPFCASKLRLYRPKKPTHATTLPLNS
jgi:hypothetical protein